VSTSRAGPRPPRAGSARRVLRGWPLGPCRGRENPPPAKMPPPSDVPPRRVWARRGRPSTARDHAFRARSDAAPAPLGVLVALDDRQADAGASRRSAGPARHDLPGALPSMGASAATAAVDLDADDVEARLERRPGGDGLLVRESRGTRCPCRHRPRLGHGHSTWTPMEVALPRNTAAAGRQQTLALVISSHMTGGFSFSRN